jgi:O-antigen/teichoic acid export membrane protein
MKTETRVRGGRVRHFFSDQGPRLLRDLLSLFGGQSVSMVLGFLAFAYLARTLGAAAYGTLEFAISLAAFAAIVIECGAGTIGVRDLARAPHRKADLAMMVMFARLLMAAFVIPAAMVIGMANVEGPAARTLIVLYAASLVAAALKQEWLLQGVERMSLAALAQPIRTAIFAGGVFLLVGRGTDLQVIGWIEIAAVMAVTGYYMFIQSRFVTAPGWGWGMADVLRLLRDGLSVGLANILWALMNFLPMFLLVTLHPDDAQPAWLGASQRIVLSLLTASYIYHFNLYPVMVRTLENDRAAWQRIMHASTHLIAWVGTAVALVLTIFASDIMGFVFGEEFVGGALALTILAWIFPLRLQTGHARWSLVATGAQNQLLLAEALGAVTLAVVAFLAIPPLGAAGAALAFGAGLAASGIVTQICISRAAGATGTVFNTMLPLGAAAAAIAANQLLGGVTGLMVAAIVFLGPAAMRQGQIRRDLHRVAYARGAPVAGS